MNAEAVHASHRCVGARPGRILATLLAVVVCASAVGGASSDQWQAGVAKTVITPNQPMWMAGYAARTRPAEGKVHDLHAKALLLQDPQGNRLAIVTLDLLGIDRTMRDWIADRLERRYRIAPKDLLINASHTHSGPVIRESAYSIYGHSFYDLTPEQLVQSNEYSDRLQERIVELVGEAIEQLSPARLSYTHARAGFGMNRRLRTEQGWRISPNPDGPVDHDVPVLRVETPDGSLQAVVFGYACHATTLSFYDYCGDYPGFAQETIEQRHPGTTALFIAGCGGDQNPFPRSPDRALELCRQHGYALANGVEAALQGPPKPVRGPLRTALQEVILDFAEPPSRETLERQAESSNKYERRHAEFLLQQLEHEGTIPATYPYLVQAIQFGDDLTIVALAGEVVVDYSLRLKRELTGPPLWVAGYSNDVFGYLPSVRVLREGGYEGGGAMLYTPLPGPFAPSVEERVVKTVHALVDAVRTPKGK
ncbi:neutral/alkaline non-lysosomal ceramidase N-terminal domain-containing protein [Anaerobaca lacustris]|uniref:Neutral/alkaline non-lysosomal ceramidase N-terminal domain-containing protein n=1 Tax=Anaerobaca lacustris TaxID=3044600 RepID=A0AAW6TWE2_9BACT|nr:neutral/alkaline non-lysosomal ceramidase N-terminal domain-containing protein [Sedimentisphaerales bacterium M17dextr]